MSFSVGVLYSARSFLQFIKKTPIKKDEFHKQFREFESAEAEGVLEAALAGQWIRIDLRGSLHPTERGEAIAAAEPAEALRMQLKYLISSTRPPWATLLSRGRECVPYLPADARQCFSEAGLLDLQSDEIARWWNILGEASRGIAEDFKNETGRKGERLSLDYEQRRTAFNPVWQSLESNYSGFDILSRVSKIDGTPLRIEVKTSTVPMDSAFFHLSRNEWDVAKTSANYLIHLWVLNPAPKLHVLELGKVKRHIPRDAGTGRWEEVKIPFAPFTR